MEFKDNNINPLAIQSNKFGVSKIGKLLIELGKVTEEQAEQVTKLQDAKNLLFGDAALQLGFVTQADIDQALSLQFNYSYLQPNEGQLDKKLIAAYEPFSPQVEALRALRSQLMLRWFNNPSHKSIALVSPNGHAESCYLAANLAIVFSQLGQRTLLIDANLREPRQHKLFNLKERKGLSDMLAGRASTEVLENIPALHNLTILGPGTPPPNPQELLSRPFFSELLDHLSTFFDVVLIDTASASDYSDANIVANYCRGALIVSNLHNTKFHELKNLRDQLQSSGIQMVAAVANN